MSSETLAFARFGGIERSKIDLLNNQSYLISLSQQSGYRSNTTDPEEIIDWEKFGKVVRTQPFVVVPNLNTSNQSLNKIQYSIQLNAIQPQQLSTKPYPVPMMTQQISTLQPTSIFTVPANDILLNLSS